MKKSEIKTADNCQKVDEKNFPRGFFHNFCDFIANSPKPSSIKQPQLQEVKGLPVATILQKNPQGVDLSADKSLNSKI